MMNLTTYRGPSDELFLRIPGSIAKRSGLTLHEKVVLARIAECPTCSNAGIADLLGVSLRGAENLVRRLRTKGQIEAIGKGRARQHRLKFPVERHQTCGEETDKNCHTLCEAQASPWHLPLVLHESTFDFFVKHRCFAGICLRRGRFEDGLGLFALIRERVLADKSLPPEAAEQMLAILNDDTTIFQTLVALSGSPRMLKRHELEKVMSTLCNATPKQLAQLRECVNDPLSISRTIHVLALTAPA